MKVSGAFSGGGVSRRYVGEGGDSCVICGDIVLLLLIIKILLIIYRLNIYIEQK